MKEKCKKFTSIIQMNDKNINDEEENEKLLMFFAEKLKV